MTEFEETDGPEYPIQQCLYDGLDMAQIQMRQHLGDKAATEINQLGEFLAHQHTTVVLSPTLRDLMTSLSDSTREDAWIKLALDCEVARSGIDRVHGSLDRYANIFPIYADKNLPDKAQGYLREVL